MNPHGKQILRRVLFIFAVVLLASFVLCPRTTRAQSYVFERADFAVERSAYIMVTADFNGDGIPDFAVISESPTAFTWTMSILSGKPGGSVGPITDYPLSGAEVGGMIAADLNGDGHLDLAVTMPASSEVASCWVRATERFRTPWAEVGGRGGSGSAVPVVADRAPRPGERWREFARGHRDGFPANAHRAGVGRRRIR
jgi:FG-GAP-like repeat